MSSQLRKRIFYALLLLFFVVSGFVIFYAEGGRFNFSTFRTETVGAIFVRSFPKDAAITIDGVAVQNQTNILSQGTFITNLTPGDYTIALTRAGYQTWQESVEVFPSKITQIQYALLVPQTATEAASSSPITTFFESDGITIEQTAAGAILLNDRLIARGTLLDHSGLASILYQAAGGDYELYDFTKSTAIDLTTILRQAGANTTAITQVTLDPRDPSVVFAETPSRIWVIDPGTGTATILRTVPTGRTIEAYSLSISRGTLAWAELDPSADASRVILYNRGAAQITTTTLQVPEALASLGWIRTGLLGVVTEDGSFYSYDTGSGTTSKLASDVVKFYPTPDGSAVAAFEHSSLEILPLNGGAYFRFTISNIKNIQSFSWAKDLNHLFVIYPDHASLLDFTDTNLENFLTIADGTAAEYDATSDSLYIVNPAGKLERYDFAE